MRVSVFESDPGHGAFLEIKARSNGRGPDVYLDGVLMSQAVTADDELGVVVRPKRDDDGALLVRDHRLQYETLRGQVEIL